MSLASEHIRWKPSTAGRPRSSPAFSRSLPNARFRPSFSASLSAWTAPKEPAQRKSANSVKNSAPSLVAFPSPSSTNASPP
ncbi:UNVERIFIED_CONTAM: hypothetical protein GTU68_052308 [Idotea baltica]|nr:hypothetical protein [Idotea baltica]